MTRPYLWSILVVTGIVLTLVSGLQWTEIVVSPGGAILSYYGFPFPWKENVELVCSPLHPQACSSPIYLTEYNWFFFAVDVLFYMGAGFGSFLIYTKYRGGKSSGPALAQV
jgi:hypothetical protein